MSQVTNSSNLAPADPQLLSMLETISNPVETINLSVQVSGVYSFPEQWKLSDEANPNLFGYSVQFLGLTFDKGKIHPRQLTQKQIKQAEEAKTKKNAKKDAKVVEEQKKLSPEEQQAERLQKQQWDALPQIQKFYQTSQNPYKSATLKFQKSVDEKVLNGQQVSELKNQIQSGDIQIILIRKPQVSQEQIAKLKKSKQKNLNLAELFKLTFKGKVNLANFLQPGQTEVKARVRLQQQQSPPDSARFEMKECYLYVTISISPSIVPLVKQISPPVQSLLVLPPKAVTNSLDNLIRKLKGDIIVAIKGINFEYQNFVQLQKQQQISKNIKHKQQNKKTIDPEERKRKFLEDFEKSGKFNILKNRFQKIISEICIDKIRKEKTINPPKIQDIQKKLIELSVFFNEQVNVVIQASIEKQPSEFHEDLVKDYTNNRQQKTDSIKQITEQSRQQVFKRAARQYQIINKTEKSESNYQNLILLDPTNQNNLSHYIQFCLRNKKFQQAEILTLKILELNNPIEYQSIMGALLLRRKRYRQSLKIFTKLSQQCETNRAVYYQLCTILYRKLEDKKATVNTRVIAEKMYKLKIGLPVRLDEQQNPYQQSKPKPPKTKPPSLLTPQQSEDFEYQVIKLFAEYNMYDVVEQFIDRVKDSTKKELYKIDIHIFNKRYSEGLKIIEKLIAGDKNNLKFIVIKADICYLQQMLFEAEQTYLLALKLKPEEESLYRIYLRLGHIYLKRKAWQDAKAIFEKTCSMKSNSSLSWLALGISNLRLKRLPEAEQALYLANIYEPLNPAAQKYLSEIHSILKTSVNSKYRSVTKSLVQQSEQPTQIQW